MQRGSLITNQPDLGDPEEDRTCPQRGPHMLSHPPPTGVSRRAWLSSEGPARTWVPIQGPDPPVFKFRGEIPKKAPVLWGERAPAIR